MKESAQQQANDQGEVMNYTAPQAAEKLGVDPKTFRRFLRSHASYRNVGTGQRYSFTDTDMPGLTTQFNAWNKTRAKRTAPDAKPARSKSSAKSTPERVESATESRARAKERVDALETSLKRRGVHISQHRS